MTDPFWVYLLAFIGACLSFTLGRVVEFSIHECRGTDKKHLERLQEKRDGLNSWLAAANWTIERRGVVFCSEEKEIIRKTCERDRLNREIAKLEKGTLP